MHVPCMECDRLHLIHAEAIRLHTEAILRYQQAKLRHDLTAVLSIKPMVRLASEDRDRAHRAILTHASLMALSHASRSA